MGYYLEAFICKTQDADLITNRFTKAVSVELDDHLSMIPMTEELFDEINQLSSSPSIGNFQYITENVEQKVLDSIGVQRFAYVEAEYFGGEGGQMSIVWNNNERIQLLAFGDGRINTVLKDFGVIARGGNDEFTMVGLLRQRHTKDWLDGENDAD
jgi:hypothetical protein